MLFDVLSRHLNVFEPHFLEASAGTGKTFAIEYLVTRQLIESDPPFLIEQILVVTFTRAATRELKCRIRRTLFQTKEALLQGDPCQDYLRALVEQGEKEVKSAIERIDAALICFDSAQIFTLHGFCYQLLKEFAFEAGMAPEVSDPDKREHLPLLEKMIKEHLKEDLCSLAYSPAQIKALLKKKQSDPRKMVAALTQLVGSGREIAEIPSHAELLALFLEELRGLPAIDKEFFKADLSLLIPHYKLMTGEEIPKQIESLAEILFSKECSQRGFDGLLGKDFFLRKMTDENKKVRAKFPEPSLLHYPTLFQQLNERILPLLEVASDPSRIFLRLARDLQKKSQIALENKERFSPDTLLLKVEEALQRPQFIHSVQKKFRSAIIDEFQDTDPVQWKIFQQLFLHNLDAICLVGDPKQSIYAFRSADLYVYLEAAKALGPYAKKYLDTNFRSRAPLVDALNLLFSCGQRGWMDLPGQTASLEVLPVKVGSVLRLNETQPPIEFFIAAGKKGRSKKFPTAGMMENKVFPFLASEISRLHREKGIEYHEIAVLVKDRFQGRDVIDYLKKRGIPASHKRGGSIAETVSYFALKEILAAVCAPFDMSRIKAALGGPLIGWQEDQLLSNVLEGKAKIQSLHHILFEKGFGPFFELLLSITWGSEPLLQELFLRGDLQHYLDLRKLAELLVEEEIERGLKGEEFLVFLGEIAMQADFDESRFKVSSAEEKNSVTVMTVHMSKGLEFDAVFALGLASRHKPSDEGVVRVEGRSRMAPLDLADPASLLALQEQDAEKMRLLYVALTRAKHYLYIPLMIEEDPQEIKLGEASPLELFFAKWMGSPVLDFVHFYAPPAGRDALMRNFNSREGLFKPIPGIKIAPEGISIQQEGHKNVQSRAVDVLDSLAPLIHYQILEEAPQYKIPKEDEPLSSLVKPSPLPMHFDHESLLSFSSLAKKAHVIATSPPQSREAAAPSPHTLPLGAETGHFLHLLLEKIFKRRLHHSLNENLLSQLIDEQLLFSAFEKWRESFLPWITQLLKQPVLSFSLSEVPGKQLQQEMEFLFPTKKGLMKGFADLVFEFEGKYYLLDWKSNYLGPSDEDYTQEKMAEAMEQNQYTLQASIYAGALKRYVKLFDNRPFAECFGGAIYYFIRGKAVYHFSPEPYLEAPHEEF